jgi:L-threonylcarbamoyladenylate synthase
MPLSLGQAPKKTFQSIKLDEAADLLKKGSIVAFPTETVYGLGASVFCQNAIKEIFRIKGRPLDNPLIVHISSLNQLEHIVEESSNHFQKLAERFFPGPLTVLLPKKRSVPEIVSAGLPTIGVRMPKHPLALALIEKVGSPLVAPSANLSGKPSSTTAQHVFEDFENSIPIFDGGPCLYGIESTVLALEPKPVILRPGAVSKEELEDVLGILIDFAASHSEKPLSPGMKYRHYAPKAKIVVFEDLQMKEAYLKANPLSRRLVISNIRSADLFSLFRHADSCGHEEIVIYCNEEMKKNAALMNRISRSSL